MKKLSLMLVASLAILPLLWSENVGRCKITASVDEMTDEKYYMIELTSETTGAYLYGLSNSLGWMAWGVQFPKSVILKHHASYSGGAQATPTLRIDNQEAYDQFAWVGDDLHSLSFLDLELHEKLKGAKKLRVRVLTYDGFATLTFDLTGFDSAVTRVEEMREAAK